MFGVNHHFGRPTLKMATAMFAKRWLIQNIRHGSHLKAEVTQ
jgi:hypothetical protein